MQNSKCQGRTTQRMYILYSSKTLVMTGYNNIEQRYYTYIDRCKEVSTITTYLTMLLVLQRLGHPTYVHF